MPGWMKIDVLPPLLVKPGIHLIKHSNPLVSISFVVYGQTSQHAANAFSMLAMFVQFRVVACTSALQLLLLLLLLNVHPSPNILDQLCLCMNCACAWVSCFHTAMTHPCIISLVRGNRPAQWQLLLFLSLCECGDCIRLFMLHLPFCA